MNRHRYATTLAVLVLLLATGAGCSDDKTPAATEGPTSSPTAADSSSPDPTATPLEGKWKATISVAAAKATLRDAGMGELIPRVVTCPDCIPSPDFELRIAGDQWLLVNGGEIIDGDETISLDGDQVTLESAEVPGEAVLRFKADETTLKLSFVSQNRPEMEPGFTEEPIIRMLYTSVPWTRVS